MEPYDLEIGPVQRTFDILFKSIGEYFQSAQVGPVGSITETDLSTYTQEQLHNTLNGSLKYYGFFDLPYTMRFTIETNSIISGIHRSDNITAYEEKRIDGSRQTFNFYSKFGPDHMKASFYSLDTKKGGEQTQGIITDEDIWYFRITAAKNIIYYLRLERELPQ